MTSIETPGGERRGARAAVIVVALVAAASLLAALARRGDDAEDAPSVRSTPMATAAPQSPRVATGLVEEGDLAPGLDLPALQGTQGLRLETLRGRVVVLNAWASWCPPCVQEMPSLDRLHRTLSARGIAASVVGITVDDPPEPARELVARLGLSLPVALDRGGVAMAAWGTVKFPETWIVAPDGRVVARVVGARDWSEPGLVDQIVRLARPS